MVRLNVEGMTCGHCVQAVTRAINAVDPAAQVQVNLAGKTVEATTRAPLSAVSKAVEDAGYTVNSAG
jgi:copper chaperone